MSDNDELNTIMAQSPSHTSPPRLANPYDAPPNGSGQGASPGRLVCWTTPDGRRYVPAGETMRTLPPAFYDIQQSSEVGIYFERLPIRTEGLLQFPDSNSERVVRDNVVDLRGGRRLEDAEQAIVNEYLRALGYR